MQTQWELDSGRGDGILTGGGSGGPTGGGTSGSNDPYATAANTREFGTFIQLLSEGPIVGPVDGIKSIYLDGTPLRNADGSDNFKGVAVALVAGTNTQAMIPGVSDVESETPVNVQLKVSTGSITRTISTAGISAIRVRISVPQLMQINSSTGARSGSDVAVKIERQSPSWNSGAWEQVPLEGGGWIWGGPFTSEYSKSFRIETPAAGPWSIRVSRLTADSPDAYTVNDTWWDAYTEVTDVKLRRPYTATLAVRVDSKQFNAIPRATLVAKGLLIQVPSNYNPTTRAYTGIWDGTFQTAWTDNPAWIWYDYATNTRYGAGSVLDASKVDKWAIYTIAQMCDTLVSDGNGGQEPRFRCSLYIQDRAQAIQALSDMASIFRGMVYEAGGAITAVQDVLKTPTAIFSNSNVKDGKFTYAGSSRKSRHTASQVTWQDPQNNYEPAVEYVEDQAAIARYGYNVTQVPGLGITSQAQAHRLGLWILLTETLETETVSFTGALEGSVLRPGETFIVRDQFRQGLGRMGGRVSSATTTVITLDSTVTLQPATTYNLSVRLPSGAVETKTVTTAAGTVSALTVGSAFSVAPDALAQWALVPVGSETIYRAITIKKGAGIEYEVMGLEHNASKFAIIDGATVTPADPRPVVAKAPVTSLTLTDSVRIEKDKLVQVLAASWVGTAQGYIAEASQDYGPWRQMEVSGSGAVLEGITSGAWRVRVQGLYPTGVSPYTQATRTVAAPTATALDAAAASAAAAAAQGTANTAQANAAAALGAAPEIGTWATFGALPATTGTSGAYPPGRYIYSTVIVDTAGDGTAGTLYKNVAGTWVRQGGALVAGKITAAMLNATLGLIGTLQSQNYVAGTSSTPATGFWLSGTAATKTALGGATYSVQFELGTSALFGGYLVGDMTKRAQPINRIRNGSFYLNLGEWTATGGVAYSASSATAGTGSAALSASTATYDVTGTLSQSFSVPGLFTGQVATLALKTALVTNSSNGDTCSVTAYLLNQSTGTETNLGTWSYATNNQTLSWTARSVDITSQVSSGGDFSLRLDLRVSNTNGIARTSTIYVDEIKIQA